MAIMKKKLMEIKKALDKSNKFVMNLYRKNGDESILELLYLDSEDPQEVADKFDIPLELAERVVEKDKAAKENPREANASEKIADGISAFLGKTEKSELYNKAFEHVASSGNENPEALADVLGITVEQAESLIEEMYLRGDIASEDADGKDESDNSDDDDNGDDSDSNSSDFPEKLSEALCFVGDVIQDASDKICDVIDESLEKFQEHEFDF
ncbi:MAG: hypothetical protein K6G18_13920 [Treponema sp.]|nr:hypothetical protein [Treponema sp.]